MGIINSQYNINLYNNGTVYNIASNPAYRLKLNSNMYCFAYLSENLKLNLDTFNVNYDNVTNMYYTYASCCNLTGNPVCGNKVTDMYQAYFICNNITGNPACGPNVISMCGTYAYCYNLSGNPACGNNVTNMYCTYLNCANLKGNPVCGPNVINMQETYYNCRNLAGDMFMHSNNVTKTTNMFYGHNSQNRINIKVNAGTTSNDSLYSQGVGCGAWTLDSTNMCYYNIANNIYVYYYLTYLNVKSKHINGTALELWDNTSGNAFNEDMSALMGAITTLNCNGIPVIDDSVEDMAYAFSNCCNLKTNLLPICGNNVTNLYSAYINCYNLTGSPVCGSNVTNMLTAYAYCIKLTGNPVCGPNIINMTQAYWYCWNLTGSPVCGPNVTSMYGTYSGCYNLTGEPVCGPNVTNMYSTYANCSNLYGNLYMQSDNVSITANMLVNHNALNRINIYVNGDTVSNSSLYRDNVGCGSWTLDEPNLRYYNAENNIYVYYTKSYSKIKTKKVQSGTLYLLTDTSGVAMNTNQSTVMNTVTKISCGNNPIIDDSVTNMSYAFYNCRNLKTNVLPICGNMVTNMCCAYLGCWNLTGSPVCGPNVTDMSGAYDGCYNLIGAPVCGPNVTNMYVTYCYAMYNFGGNMFMQSDKVSNTRDMLFKNNNYRLNIYVRGGTTTNSTIYSMGVGMGNTWSRNTSNNCYYNSTINIYVYYNWDGVMW